MASKLMSLLAMLALSVPSNNNINSSMGLESKIPYHDFNQHYESFRHSPNIPEPYFPEYLDNCILSLGYVETINNDFIVTQTFIEDYDCNSIDKPSYLYTIDLSHTTEGIIRTISSYHNDTSNGLMGWGYNRNDALELWFSEGYVAVTFEGTYVNRKGEIPFIIEDNHDAIRMLRLRHEWLLSNTERINGE
ncbi:MAG: hypothetical protein ACMXYL_04005 [Candidatus Woesearchaeota archaeon]